MQMGRGMLGRSLVAWLTALACGAVAAGQILTGPFSPASPPFLSQFGAGILYLGPTQIQLDQNLDGTPDATFDLPPEIQASPIGAFLIDARLSPTEKTLYTIKTPGTGPVPGCNPTDARIYFHSIGAPPSGLSALNPGGNCIAGPIAAGPLFNDLSATSTIRTGIVVGAAPAVPSKTQVLWVDLVHGGANLDGLNYFTDVEPTIGGIQFAPSGNAAYIQHGSNTATPKYTLVDLCVSPIAAAGSLATGDLPPGQPSAWITPGAGPGTFIAEVRVGGSPIVTSRMNLSVCATSSGPPPSLTVVDAGDALHNSPSGCAITGSGGCTLRDAITYGNTHPGGVVHFAIPGPGVHTISPATPLPLIVAPMTIDGYSQAGASPNSNPPGVGTNAAIRIEIDGANRSLSGLAVNAGHVTIRGLAINRVIHGITMGAQGVGAVIAGNFIGTDATGTIARNNSGSGVVGSGALIGGPAPADRNVISGNNSYAVSGGTLVIQGNLIGLNAAGTGVLGNGSGPSLFPGSLLGGTTPGERNVIAGSGNGAIHALAPVVISGNYVGVDVTGTSTFSGSDGVVLTGDGSTLGGASGTSPGGTCTGTCNVISSPYGRVVVSGSGNTVAGNFIGLNAAGTAVLGARTGYCLTVSNAPGTTIGGTSPSARNVIAGCFEGIILSNSPNTTIAGNFLGTDSAGAAVPIPIDVGAYGVVVGDSDGTVIGGTTGVTPGGNCTGSCNVIAGWEAGIAVGYFGGGPSAGLLIQGNHIGAGLAAATSLPNNTGIQVTPPFGPSSTVSVTIGGATAAAGNLIVNNASLGIGIGGGIGTRIQNNTISGNGLGGAVGAITHDGIAIEGGTGTTITQNSIFGNGGLGIDLPPIFTTGMPTPNDPCDADIGENDLQNYPVLTSASVTGSATTVVGSLNSTASTSFTVDFYSNPACDASGYGEGKTYLGSKVVTTDATCGASFSASLPVAAPAGSFITATATNPAGSTSEFSLCVALAGGSPGATQFYSVAPCRVIDTRSAPGPLGGPALVANAVRRFVLAGACGIPVTAKAVAANVAVTAPSAGGNLTVYPAGAALPTTSTINYATGRTRANNAILPLGPNGDVDVFASQGSGRVDLILDVAGYFQ